MESAVLFVTEDKHFISTIWCNIFKEHVHVRQLWYHLRPQCHEAKIDFVFNFLFPWKNYISRSVQQSIFRRFTFWTLSFIGWCMWQMFHNTIYISNAIKIEKVLYALDRIFPLRILQLTSDSSNNVKHYFLFV